jgi:hypothetical protein
MTEEEEYARLELTLLEKQRDQLQDDMMLSEAFPGPLDEERREELSGVRLKIIAAYRKLDAML